MPKEKDQPSRSKVRIFYAEIDGNDDAVEALVQAFGRATQPQSRIVKTVSIARAIPADQADSLEAVPEDDEVDLDAEDEGEEEQANSGATKVNQKPRKKPTYQLVSNINLRPDSKQSLKDFYAEKAPSDSQEQSAVFVYYFQKILECKNIGANHLYTAFKEVSVRSPIDIMKVARNTSTRKGWINASDGSNILIEISGENFVEHDLPAKKATK